MKMNRMLFAAVMVMVAVFFGCKDSGGGLGAPGAKSVKDLPSFTGTFVASEDDAADLFLEAFEDIIGDLMDAYGTAYETAFKAAYSTTSSSSAYINAEKGTKNSVSYSVKFKDEVALKAKTSAGAILDVSDKYSESTNVANLNTPLTKVGDTNSSSSSMKATATVKTLYSKSGSKYAYIMTMENKSDYKETVKKVATATENKQTDYSYSGKESFSIALSASDGTNGAKFRFSFADESKDAQRKIDYSGGVAVSNLEVYDNENTLKFTIKDTEDIYYAIMVIFGY